jgi:S-adenosylmethionine hydrolase
MRTISLCTDFGTSDWFVGTMKGVILGINARASIVDITHGIPAGDIRAGAIALKMSYRFFPRRTVHVAVVDPGVGTDRAAIAVRTQNYFFVGPDNGVMSWALASEKVVGTWRLENPKYFLTKISNTFHGRDIFAPVAAHLSIGLPPQKLGPVAGEIVTIPWPGPKLLAGKVQGEIVYIDHFGNAITNIESPLIRNRENCVCEIARPRRIRCRLGSSYAAVPAGQPIAIIGSSGLLEVAVNGYSAARKFGLQVGNIVSVKL